MVFFTQWAVILPLITGLLTKDSYPQKKMYIMTNVGCAVIKKNYERPRLEQNKSLHINIILLQQ